MLHVDVAKEQIRRNRSANLVIDSQHKLRKAYSIVVALRREVLILRGNSPQIEICALTLQIICTYVHLEGFDLYICT